MLEPKLNSLLSALHLASPALPVGGFAYSQGLEQAIEDRWVTDAEQAYVWIRDVMLLSLARQELPWWLRCYDAAEAGHWPVLLEANVQLCALRETAEFRLESLQMGYSMAKLFAQWPGTRVLAALSEGSLGIDAVGVFAQEKAGGEVMDRGAATGNDKGVAWSYPAAYAALAAASGVEQDTALAAYLWSWVENQVLAAMKTVPLGQIEGQQLLHRLKADIGQACEIARSTEITQTGSAALGLTVASARHETQYSRLFRS